MNITRAIAVGIFTCNLISLPAAPALSAVVDCKEGVPEIDYRLPETQIGFFRSWNKFRRPVPPPKLFLPDATKVSALLDSKGFIWLFRVINRSYRKGFDQSRFIRHQSTGYSESGYSYSLSPHIGLDWEPDGKIILVSRQKLQEDHITFPRNYLQDVRKRTMKPF